jgi:hypothetical protein
MPAGSLKKRNSKRRRIMKKLIVICAAVTAVLAGIVLTSTANATTYYGTVNIQNHNNSLSDMGQLFSPSLGSGSGGTYYTGIYSWDAIPLNDPLHDPCGFLSAQIPGWGFCIELTQGPFNGVHNIIALEDAPLPAGLYGSPMGPIKANYIRELWDKYADTNWPTNIALDPTNTQRKYAETFSACIWEIIYEPNTGAAAWDVTTNPTGQGFRATGINATTANTWLDSLTGAAPSDDTMMHLVAISPQNGHNGQDYLVYLNGPGLPEPATICLLGLGALSLIRRKKQ